MSDTTTNLFSYFKGNVNLDACENKPAAKNKVTLTFNGTTIHSLKELRDNFDKDACLKALMDKSLYYWLSQHYYITEADEIKGLDITDKNCFCRLCEILSVDYVNYADLSEDEKEKLDQKKALVKEIIEKTHGDAGILSEIHLTAMNQEELASLLDRDEKKIYLCNGTFSIPISIPGHEYIGIGPVTIENAFTKEQYLKAGITVTNITLPDKINAKTEDIAKTAALNNGYDDFADSHSPLTTAIHYQLTARKMYSFYRLPNNASLTTKFFTRRSECEAAKMRALKKAYNCAEQYLTPGNSKCIANEAAQNYSKIIESCFSPIMEKLRVFCNLTGNDNIYSDLSDLVKNSYKNLLARFENELTDCSDYYKMYQFDYFVDQADIEEHDYRVNEDGIFKILEGIFSDSIQYTLPNLFSTINEMENDLNDHANTFFTTILSEYNDYIGRIGDLINNIKVDLFESAKNDSPNNINKNESLSDYIDRLCIANAH